MTDTFRDLCGELKAALQNRSILTHDEMNLVFRARAALAEAAPKGKVRLMHSDSKYGPWEPLKDGEKTKRY
jgi:hypothetical protein